MSSLPDLITSDLSVSEIVANNYRTAEVFRKYNIDFCCGGKMPLKMACELKNLDKSILLTELQEFADAFQHAGHWSVDFIIDYIINIHHNYINNNIPVVTDYIQKFTTSHGKNYPEQQLLPELTLQLFNNLTEQVNYEGESLFPYIKRIAYAHNKNEVYGKHLIRSFHKLSVTDLERYHAPINLYIQEIEHLTNRFKLPENACITHRVMLQKLQEFINSIQQYIFIETKYLIPLTLQMEKTLLERYIEK